MFAGSLLFSTLKVVLHLSRPDRCKSHRHRSNVFVVARLLIPKKLKFELLFDVVVCGNLGGQDRESIPFEGAIFKRLNF